MAYKLKIKLARVGYFPVMSDMGNAKNPNMEAIISNIKSISAYINQEAEGHNITPPRMTDMGNSNNGYIMYGIIWNIKAISAFLTKALVDAKSDLDPPILKPMGNHRNPNMENLIANIYILNEFIMKAAIHAEKPEK